MSQPGEPEGEADTDPPEGVDEADDAVSEALDARLTRRARWADIIVDH